MGKRRILDANLMIRLPANLKARARRVAKAKGMDLSLVIRGLLAAWLDLEERRTSKHTD